MKQINLSEVKPEMVLARDVYGRNESLLMGKGVTLSSESIVQLSHLGIGQVWIEAPDEKEETDNKEIEKIIKELEAQLDDQFRLVSHNPIMQDLKRICARYLIRKRTG